MSMNKTKLTKILPVRKETNMTDMTDWKFRIFMWGMIAFVFRPDGSRARVLLVNALDRDEDKHVPELSFDTKFQRKSLLGIPDPPESELESGKWKLKNVDLQLRPESEITLSDQFRLVNGALPNKPIKKLPDSNDFGTISYLVKLDQLFVDSPVSRIDPVFLGDSVNSDLCIVRMQLGHGRLGVTQLANEKFWAFAPRGNSSNALKHRQPCAIEVCCEISVPRGQLTLVGKPFGGGPEFGIAFEPDTNRIVEVRLANRPTMGEALRDVELGGMDEDFGLYYGLSSKVIESDEQVLPIDPKETTSSEGDLRSKQMLPVDQSDKPSIGLPFPSGNCIQIRFADDEGA